ncbi:MAG: YhdH/YhfP family quinone oxidoreductase [Pseudomonadota bacterium]
MTQVRAFRIHDQHGDARLEILQQEALSPGSVVIRAQYSSVNYKDALAATGRGRILRRFPLVGGIDVAGVVVQSEDARCAVGAPVLVTGCGLGESHDGGFAELVRVPADWVVPLPDGLSLREAMVLGTAGFTAALAIDRMEQNGQTPAHGPVLVTGATGGVGSVAIDLLAGAGYEVIALSRKPDHDGYLAQLGASRVLDPAATVHGDAPLERALWGGAIDNVGGDTLAWLTRTVKPWGNIAGVGLAGGTGLHTTVMPFILRGVSLLGITSANCPPDRRRRIWRRLVTDLRPRHLDRMVAGEVTLDKLPGVFERVLSGSHRGRYLVAIDNH